MIDRSIERKMDTPILVAAALFGGAISLAWALDSGPVIAYGIFVVFAIYMVKVRQGFGDPAVISLFTFVLYAAVPLFDVATSTEADFGYDVQGALFIYSTASIAMIVATGVAFAVFPAAESGAAPRVSAFHVEAAIAASLSVFLSMIFIAQHGIFLIGGAGDYLDRFANLAVPGSGILFLSYPLATATLCFAIVSFDRLSIMYAYCLIPYLLLFLSLGQRKFVLIPFLLLTFRFLRTKSFLQVIGLFAVAIFGFAVFNYIGFLREAEIGFSEALDAKILTRYLDDFSVSNGEVYILYVTAASAYAHAVDGSFMHNYIAPFQLLLPQFLTGTTYRTIEQEFAALAEPEVADSNGGMGYSFFGEAYVVGDVLGIFLATIAITLILRCIFVLGKGLRFTGIWGVVSLALTYQGMWYLRQGFGMLLHEVTIQIVIILGIHAAVRLSRLRHEREVAA
jgi:hypothetical protein